MPQLYVVRHGQSVYNAKGIFAGQTDTPLTDLGREQAHIAGQSATNLSIDLIIASPLVRALETAQIIASEINYDIERIVVMDELKERALGTLEGQPFSAIPDEADHPDIEHADHLAARVQATIDYIKMQEVDAILLVAHGSYIKALSAALAPGKFTEELPNAVIVRLV